MVKTHIIIPPVFLTPVLAGKVFDGRGSPSVKRKLGSIVMEGVFRGSKALGSGTEGGPGGGHGQETGIWLPSGKETRTSKCAS